MSYIVKPLETAGKEGLIMVSGDGVARQCFPILAAYVGDYPEQLLVSLIKTGECPVCDSPRGGIGDLENTSEPRNIIPILEALESIAEGPRIFTAACAEAGIKPIQCPFWKNLPFVNIYNSITPDILHQLYQGVIKHLLQWLQTACSKAEIDARCHRLPPNHNIRLFLKGITHLSRVAGTEHDQICRFIIGLIINIQLPDGYSNARLVRAVRATLDFLYLAKYPIHSSDTLDSLEEALRAFHEDRSIFIDLGIRSNFNIPKLHSMGHYRHFIERFGTLDNFNTEYTERLHIDLAKDAYRATNSKDEYPQMTTWLDRQEKIMLHEKFIRRCQEASQGLPSFPRVLPSLIPSRSQRMAKHPTHKAVPLSTIQDNYGARDFDAAL